MKEMKKWVKPELVVLLRRKPEEGILVSCQASGSGSTNATFYETCDYGRHYACHD